MEGLIIRFPRKKPFCFENEVEKQFETYIFGELLKSYWYQGKEAPFYFYRDQDQNEVDLLIETADTLYPIEIKKVPCLQEKAARVLSQSPSLEKREERFSL